MSDLVVSAEIDNAGSRREADEGAGVERRLFHTMCGVVACAVAASAFLFPWRVTAGLLLGGVLALLNYSWVRSSVRAAFAPVENADEAAGGTAGKRPRWGVSRYVLRYFVVAGVVAVAHSLGLVSLVAVMCGLCAFAAAGMIEGLIQLYLAIVNRKDA